MTPVRSKPLCRREPLIVRYVWRAPASIPGNADHSLTTSFICGTILIQRANHTAGGMEPHGSVSSSPLTRANQQANHPFKVRFSGDQSPPPTTTTTLLLPVRLYGACTLTFSLFISCALNHQCNKLRRPARRRAFMCKHQPM